MPQLIIAIAILFGAWYAMRLFAKTPPATLAKYIRGAGGVSALGTAVFLFMRGAAPAAALLGAFGAFLLGLSIFPGVPAFAMRAGRAPRRGRVRRWLRWGLPGLTGAMSGTVLAGPLEARSQVALTRPACEELYRQCLADDPDGARLLETYLDRRFAGWRQTGEGEGDAGRDRRETRRPARVHDGG